jgi:hypothetical protein
MNFNLKLLSAVAVFSIISNSVFAGWDTAKRRTLNKLENAINQNLITLKLRLPQLREINLNLKF